MKAVCILLYRKAMQELEAWRTEKTHQALLVTGARQVGKTTIVREFARKKYEDLAEINFVETPSAAQTLNAATNEKDLLLRLSVLAESISCQAKRFFSLMRCRNAEIC